MGWSTKQAIDSDGVQAGVELSQAFKLDINLAKSRYQTLQKRFRGAK